MGWREEEAKYQEAKEKAKAANKAYLERDSIFGLGLVKGTQSDNEKPVSNFQCPRCGCNTIVEVTDILNTKQWKCICERHTCNWEREVN